jgi:DNA-binding MarR family transcriptional regulator
MDIQKLNFDSALTPLIGKTYKLINVFFAEVFQENNIQVSKEQWIVLKILIEEKNGCIQNELAFIANRNKASLTRLINGMEKNNLVVRVPSKNDSRKNLVFITETGKKLFHQMKPLMLASIEKIEKGLSMAEKEHFKQIILKIQENLKKSYN